MRAGLLGAGLLMLSACRGGAPTDIGIHALLRVPGAQFYPGAMPSAQDGGPGIKVLLVDRTVVTAGSEDRSVHGSCDATATAAALGLDGDSGYWVVTTGPAAAFEDGFPTFGVDLGFSSLLTAGMATFRAQAVDANGHFGPPSLQPLQVTSGDVLPAGQLVVSLRWDTESDMDLHVVDPNGVEIWAHNINSYSYPSGTVPGPDDWKDGGILDFDSNANCQIDGRRQENVIWAGTPPSGHYVVRVDAASLCGQSEANWSVDVRRAGTLQGHAQGTAVEASTRGAPAPGAGQTALQFDWP